MTNREKDIQRYLRGEMSPAEQHALEKAALSDPFLAEALEGLNNLTEAELTEDLENISAELETQTEHVWQMPAASAKRMAAAEAASFAGDELNAEPPVKPAAKPKRNWWPLRIAALLVVLIGGYLFVPLLFTNSKDDLALTKNKAEYEQTPENALILDDTTSTQPTEVTEKKSTIDTKSSAKAQEKSGTKPTLADAKKDSVTNSSLVHADLEQPDKITTITTAPAVVLQPEAEERKKISASDLQSESSVAGYSIRGRVLEQEDQTPLPGVNIVIKGTTTGVVTDINGRYQITSTLPNPTLQYSFIGLQTEEVVVKQPGEINVEMKADVSQLSEVVITGYSPAGVNPNREPVIKLAQPAGGLRAYDKYLKNSLVYPQQAFENNVKGKVTVSFTVFTDGKVDEFNVLKGLGYGCDEEVIRLVKAGPKWSPTTQDGEPVESEVRVRVKFAPPTR